MWHISLFREISMGKQMSIRELRAALTVIESELVEHGEITLTRNGKPIAKISAADLPQAERIVPDLTELRRKTPLTKTSTAELLDEIRGPR